MDQINVQFHNLDLQEEELATQHLLKLLKLQFEKFEEENKKNVRNFVQGQGLTYEQVALAHAACGLPLDDDTLQQIIEQADPFKTGYVTLKSVQSNILNSQDEAEEDFIIPMNLTEKQTALNKLFDEHRKPAFNKDEDIHSQIDLVELRKILEGQQKNGDPSQLTVDDFDFYFRSFIDSKGSTSGPIMMNNVEFSTEIDKVQDMILYGQVPSFQQSGTSWQSNHTAKNQDKMKTKVLREMSIINKSERPEAALLNLVKDMSSENMWSKFSSEQDSKKFVAGLEHNLEVIIKEMDGLRDQVLSQKGISGQLRQEKDNQGDQLEGLKKDKLLLVDSNDKMKDKIDAMAREMESLAQLRVENEKLKTLLEHNEEQVQDLKQKALKDGLNLKKMQELIVAHEHDMKELNEELMHYKTLSFQGLDQIERKPSVDHKQQLQKINQKVEVSDYLDKELEKQYMAVILEMVEGKVTTLGSKQIEAIVAIRREYSRRNIELNSYDKKFQKFKKLSDKDSKKIKQLEQALEQQYEYNQSVTRQVNKLQANNQLLSQSFAQSHNTFSNFSQSKSTVKSPFPIPQINEESDKSETNDELANFEENFDFTNIGLELQGDKDRSESIYSQAQMYEGEDVIEGLMEETRQSQLRMSQYDQNQTAEAQNHNVSEQVVTLPIDQETKAAKEMDDLENHNQIYSMQIDSHPRVLSELQDQQNIIDMRISGKANLPQIESSTQGQVSQMEISGKPPSPQAIVESRGQVMEMQIDSHQIQQSNFMNQLEGSNNIVDISIQEEADIQKAIMQSMAMFDTSTQVEFNQDISTQGQVASMQIDSRTKQLNQLSNEQSIYDIRISGKQIPPEKMHVKSIDIQGTSLLSSWDQREEEKLDINQVSVENNQQMPAQSNQLGLQDDQGAMRRLSTIIETDQESNFMTSASLNLQKSQVQVASQNQRRSSEAPSAENLDQSELNLDESLSKIPDLPDELKSLRGSSSIDPNENSHPRNLYSSSQSQDPREPSKSLSHLEIQSKEPSKIKENLDGTSLMLGSSKPIEKASLNTLEISPSVQQITIQNLEPGPLEFKVSAKRKKIPLSRSAKSSSSKNSLKASDRGDLKESDSSPQPPAPEGSEMVRQMHSLEKREMDKISEEAEEVTESHASQTQTEKSKVVKQQKGINKNLMIDTERNESENTQQVRTPISANQMKQLTQSEISPDMIMLSTANKGAKKFNLSSDDPWTQNNQALTTKNQGGFLMSFDQIQENERQNFAINQSAYSRDKRHNVYVSEAQRQNMSSFLSKVSKQQTVSSQEQDPDEDRDKIDDLEEIPAIKKSQDNLPAQFQPVEGLSREQSEVMLKKIKRITIARGNSEIRQSSALRMSNAVQSSIQTRENQDHLNLRDPISQNYRAVTANIVSKGEQKYSDFVFSDEFNKYDPKLAKKKVVVLVTDTSLFVLECGTYRIENFVYLKDLYKIITIKTNSSLFALNFAGDVAFLFDSYRRTEFLVFLIQVSENLLAKGKIKQKPEIQKTTRLKLQSAVNKEGQIVDFSKRAQANVSKRKSILNTLGDRDFFMASKYGYLQKRSKTTRLYESSMWHEQFYVLCNVGLLYMRDPQDRDIKLFVSQEFEVNEEPFQTFKKDFVIRLTSQAGSAQDMLMQANSRKDFEEWVKALKEFKQKLDEAKTNRIQYLDSSIPR